jgi:hypothetical protein
MGASLMGGIRLGGKATPPVVSYPVSIYSIADGEYVLLSGPNIELTPLPENEDMNNAVPSPDGTMVAFQWNFPGPSGEGQIAWVPIGGGTPTVVSAPDAGGPWFVHPDWRPDSGGLIYIHADPTEGTDGSIVSVELDDPGNETVLYTPSVVGTPNGYGPYRPQYSPDGTQIVFLLNGEAGSDPADEGLYVMDADGTNVVQIDAFHPGYSFDGEQFSWAPDGSLIAYWDGTDAGLPSSFGKFWVIAPDGTGKTQISIGLTDNNPDFSGSGNKVEKRMSRFAWAPDSSYVVASAKWYNGSSFVWRPWRYETDGVTDETRISDTRGPAGFEFFRQVYVYGSRLWFIDKITTHARVVSLALDGTDYVVETTVGTDCDGDAFYGGDGTTWR